MKKKSLIIASALLLLGAGCAPQPQPQTPSVIIPPDFLQPNAPVPAPATTNPSDTATPMPKTWTFPGVLPAAEIHNKEIRMVTSKGTIVFKLFDADAPKAVSNFVYLTKGGFYDGLTFHRREEGFVIQGGDPNGNGTGGPGYQFADEKVTRQYTRGIVAMANAGPNTNGSQFFIMLADTPLPPQYTIFGQVTVGMDVVDKIQVGDVMTKVTVEAAK